jgi:hypothetical protein
VLACDVRAFAASCEVGEVEPPLPSDAESDGVGVDGELVDGLGLPLVDGDGLADAVAEGETDDGGLVGPPPEDLPRRLQLVLLVGELRTLLPAVGWLLGRFDLPWLP